MRRSFAFPRLYAPWMEELLQGAAVPAQSRSDCAHCVMCAELQPPDPNDYHFHPRVRCCGYMPDLPNFLAGAALLDDCCRSQFEREAIKAVVLPSGVAPSGWYSFMQRIKPFGQLEALLCPYSSFEGGVPGCGIWPHRNAICATWFCRYDRRVTGESFWLELRRLLLKIEKAMAAWCIKVLQWEALPFPRNEREAAWGNWSGREREFFIACYHRVAGLKWHEVLAIGGAEAAEQTEQVARALQRLANNNLPTRLGPGKFTYQELPNGFVRVWGYSRFDPIDLPEETFQLLSHFDGSSTETVLARTRLEKEIAPTEATVQLLIDAGLLIAR